MGRFGWKSVSADEDTVVVLSGFAAVLVMLVVGTIGAALARDDSGMHQFFAGSGGGGEPSSRATIAPEPSYAAPTLTIHRDDLRRIAHRRPSDRQPQIARRDRQPQFARRDHKAPVVASLPVPLPPVWDAANLTDRPAAVSLYQDRTLRRGDAVMTLKGIRIFAGSKTFPFRPEDFRNVTAFKARDVPFRKALIELNRLPSAG